MASVTIHRGTHQIGGCVTEVSCGDFHVFIDIGENLSDKDAKLNAIDGLTTGNISNSALFLTHYHGDHIGKLNDVLPEIPVYMGETAKVILRNLTERTNAERLSAVDKINTFKPLDKIQVGEITVTPLMIDHSAFDAYMFVIETNGCCILHTGDFRLHGVRGGKTLKMLEYYAKNIDYIICEGTTLSRDGEPPMTEYQLQQDAAELMKTTPYIFVLCSSTNIDRIGAFYHANPKGRLFICDSYQKKQLETVRKNHADKSSFYDFKYVKTYGKNLDEIMGKMGFCMLVRQGGFFSRLMDKYKEKSLLIYSMWTGYLDERGMNRGLCDFIKPYHYRVLHTSGHATAEDLKRLYDEVRPKQGLIPIHTEVPETFAEIIPKEKLIILQDGEELIL